MGACLSRRRDAHARSLVERVLASVSIGRLHIYLQYPAAAGVKLLFGQKDGDVDEQLVATLIKNQSIWWKACWNMDLVLAEGYLTGDVDCDDWVKLFMIYIANRKNLPTGLPGIQHILRLQRVFSSGNTLARTRPQIASHYDASGAHFRGFLSADMNYSAPLWELGRNDETLEDAQRRKVHHVLAQACVAPGDHVLDIGCGWGDLAIAAARTTPGCRVTGVTLSHEQKAVAEERIRAAGLEDRITILLCDYREIPAVPGGYDKAICIEMLEHVGRKHYPTFFSTISKLLNPTHGTMVLQVTTAVWDRHQANRSRPEGFMNRYIFPGGYIPHTHHVLDTIHRGSRGTLEIRNVLSIGPHYVKALRVWRETFLRNWDAHIKPALQTEEMDEAALESFRRKWEYYFSCCEAGFRSGMLGSVVVTASRASTDLFIGVPL